MHTIILYGPKSDTIVLMSQVTTHILNERPPHLHRTVMKAPGNNRKPAFLCRLWTRGLPARFESRRGTFGQPVRVKRGCPTHRKRPINVSAYFFQVSSQGSSGVSPDFNATRAGNKFWFSPASQAEISPPPPWPSPLLPQRPVAARSPPDGLLPPTPGGLGSDGGQHALPRSHSCCPVEQRPKGMGTRGKDPRTPGRGPLLSPGGNARSPGCDSGLEDVRTEGGLWRAQ